MTLPEYSDDELLEEVNHRGFNVKIVDFETVMIGGKRFYVN